MAGNTNFPTGLDDDSSLYDVTDGVSSIVAAHHNNIKEAIKAIERSLGIINTSSATAVDYRLGSPTNSHKHDGASGQGQRINPTAIQVPSGGYPSGGYLYDHLMNATLHNPSALLATGNATMLAPALLSVPTSISRFIALNYAVGSMVVGSNKGIPFSFGRTMQLENVRANLRVGPSGATTALDVNVGPTSLWQASVGNRPIFIPGATDYGNASPNLITYPSGGIITIDVDAVGSNDPGQDLSITFTFRD